MCDAKEGGEVRTATVNGDGEKLELLSPNEQMSSFADRFITPRVVLIVFTLMNFFTYYDRGAIAGCLSNVRADSTIAGNGVLPQTQSGAIVSAFMVGFMVTCPLFVGLGGRYSAKQIMVFGLLVWCLACIGTGCSVAYWMILTCRCFVGIGEAAYVGFSVTIIDNIAPPAKRTLWIGCFYSMIPVGQAMGMGLGGIIGSHGTIGSIPGWRVAFLTEVLAMLPIVAIIAFLPQRYNPIKKEQAYPALDDDAAPQHVGEEIDKSAGHHVSLMAATKLLVRNSHFILITLGYGTYTFVLGGVAVWAIQMLEQGPLGMSQDGASMLMGGSVAFTGLVGSVVGGKIVDMIGGSEGQKGVMKCCIFDALAMAVSVPLGVLAIFSNSLALFAPLFIAAVFCLFAVTAPVNAATLSCVQPDLRAYAISFSVLILHAVGDFPSPIVAGAMSDSFSEGCDNIEIEYNCTKNPEQHCVWMPKHDLDNAFCANRYQLRNALGIVYLVLILAIPCWGYVAWSVRRAISSDKRHETSTKRDCSPADEASSAGVSLCTQDNTTRNLMSGATTTNFQNAAVQRKVTPAKLGVDE